MKEAEQEKAPAQGIWCGKMCPELSAPTKEVPEMGNSKNPYYNSEGYADPTAMGVGSKE